jgi:condensin complex subunit 2
MDLNTFADGALSDIRLSLNDDRNEKAARLQSRQALQDIHLNQIKAAASPMRKKNGSETNRKTTDSSSPQTPRSGAASGRDGDHDRGKENNDPDGSPGVLNVVSNSVVTPMKRVPILANFEEWMKMATDNKINAANSWNFALIDYFHDMSLLKEGDGVNFQKASCTLDGCVKIYTSRVDSVASETGKLLSGLADSGGGKKAREKTGADGDAGSGDENGDDEEEEGEDGVRKKVKKKVRESIRCKMGLMTKADMVDPDTEIA